MCARVWGVGGIRENAREGEKRVSGQLPKGDGGNEEGNEWQTRSLIEVG